MDATSSPFVPAEAFCRAPTGKAVAAPHAVFWRATRDLLLIAVWDRMSSEDYAVFEQIAPVWLGDEAPARRSVLDMRRLISVDDDAMSRFVAFVVTRRETYLRTLQRCSLVVEPTAPMAAALIAGLPTLAAAPSPFSAHTDLRDALHALQVDDAGGVADQLEALTERAVADGRLLTALGAYLCDHMLDAPIQGAASQLGLSVRTLQRRLRDLGTSFQRELDRARVVRGQHLLARTDDKVQSIALAVGLEKAQHFAQLFRRWTGRTPSEWRAAAAKAPDKSPGPTG